MRVLFKLGTTHKDNDMKAFVAIVKWSGSTVSKYQDFDTQAEADSHVTTYSGFVAPNPGGSTGYWVVDAEAETVVNNQDQADADALASNWERLRRERNAKLAESDWTQYADSPLSDEVKAEWAVHRQLLRDLPDTTDDPANPTWPEVPE